MQATITSNSVPYTVPDRMIGDQYFTIKLDIWDTPGGDHFAKVQSADYMNADIVIMVYSID